MLAGMGTHIALRDRSHKRRQGRIRNGVTDESFQPLRHRPFIQRGFIQPGLDTKTCARSNDSDYRRRVITLWKQFLLLKLTKGAVEAAIGFDQRSNLRQVFERTMHRAAVDGAGGRFNRLKIAECVF